MPRTISRAHTPPSLQERAEKRRASMDVMEAIQGRRSVREYTDQPVEREVIQRLVNAAAWAPSAMNEQPWTFTVTQNQALLDRISNAAKAHVLAASAQSPKFQHYDKLLRDENFHIFYHAPALVVISAPAKARWAVEDCALAAQNLMLAACAMGLGTCWIGFAQDWLGTKEGRRVLGISESSLPVAPIIVGYPKNLTSGVPRKQADIRWVD